MNHDQRWFKPLAEDDRPLLFCLPFAGGGSAGFRQWPALLGDLVQVCPVLLPGRETRLGEPAADSMAPLVEALAAALRPLCGRRWSVYGHSMGAAIAWELAVRCADQAQLQPPEWLLLSGRGAPGLARHRAPLHELDDHAFRAALGRLGGTTPEVLAEDELMELLLPMLRADFRLIETWQPTLAVLEHTRILAVGADDDPESVAERLHGWRDRSRAQVRLATLRGDHFSIFQQPTLLLQQIRSALGALP